MCFLLLIGQDNDEVIMIEDIDKEDDNIVDENEDDVEGMWSWIVGLYTCKYESFTEVLLLSLYFYTSYLYFC